MGTKQFPIAKVVDVVAVTKCGECPAICVGLDGEQPRCERLRMLDNTIYNIHKIHFCCPLEDMFKEEEIEPVLRTFWVRLKLGDLVLDEEEYTIETFPEDSEDTVETIIRERAWEALRYLADAIEPDWEEITHGG